VRACGLAIRWFPTLIANIGSRRAITPRFEDVRKARTISQIEATWLVRNPAAASRL
jgi:hypothetical protein